MSSKQSRFAVGTQIGKYAVEEFLGNRGLTEVYRARQPIIGRSCVIKVLTSDDAEQVRALTAATRKMGQLEHPNIEKLYDVGQQDSFPFLVLEFVELRSMKRIAEDGGTKDVLGLLEVMARVVLALEYAHQAKDDDVESDEDDEVVEAGSWMYAYLEGAPSKKSRKE